MASLGKADGGASCLSSQCFDPLTRSCVMCSELFGDNTSKCGQGLVVKGAGGRCGVGLEGTFCGLRWKWRWRWGGAPSLQPQCWETLVMPFCPF